MVLLDIKIQTKQNFGEAMTTTEWTGSSGNNEFLDSGNWSNGVPDSTNYDAVFDLNGDLTLSDNLTNSSDSNLNDGYVSLNSISVSGGYNLSLQLYATVEHDGQVYEDAVNYSLNSLDVSSGSSITIGGTSVGGNVTLNGDITGSGTVNIGDQSNLIIAGGSTSSDITINFGSNSNLYVGNSVEFDAHITNFSASSYINFALAAAAEDITGGSPVWTENSDGSYTFSVNKNGTITTLATNISFASGVTPDDITWDSENDTFTCFLSGSMIRTLSGDIAVQDLKRGDKVVVHIDGAEKFRHVIWVGRAQCNVRPYLPLDQAGYPVRVVKDAISDGVPFKDMLITSEHCLFFDDKFVPVRMLVNGRSIFYDTTITSYEYYHIETQEHSVIMADGMFTESYLDTGNRRAFTQSENVVSITQPRNLRWDDAAVPLAVSREIVEPLFRKIENRAEKAGFAIQVEAHPLTNDSDLHLTTDTGAVIHPARQNNGRVMFMIPSGVESVRIVSNASRPCDVIGPFIDDRRSLGVLVGTVTLFESNRTRMLTDHLHDVQLSGWNNVEEGTMRWTSGNALLPLGERAPGSLALMAIEVRAAGPYVLDETISERQALKA